MIDSEAEQKEGFVKTNSFLIGKIDIGRRILSFLIVIILGFLLIKNSMGNTFNLSTIFLAPLLFVALDYLRHELQKKDDQEKGYEPRLKLWGLGLTP